MSERPEPFWHWPGWGQLGYAAFLALVVSVWFEVIFAGADWITAQHRFRVRVHLDAELRLPFIPAAVLGYLSIYPLFAMTPFVLRTRRQLRALAATLAIVILCAGACFLFVPALVAFPPTGEMGSWTLLVRFAKLVALTNNLVPSLHVALSVACIAICSRYSSRLGAGLLWLWAGVIALSTLLLYQHYIVDVVTGTILGWVGARCTYDRWTRGE